MEVHNFGIDTFHSCMHISLGQSRPKPGFWLSPHRDQPNVLYQVEKNL